MKKLCNKKTGEIGDLLGTYNAVPFIGIAIDYHDGNPVRYEYNSIAELNEEWEDYKPKEPLIKDEKVRKAVRVWAEANELQEVYCASNGYEVYGGIDDYVIQFEGEPFPFADRNKLYTITELCGEEEE